MTVQLVFVQFNPDYVEMIKEDKNFVRHKKEINLFSQSIRPTRKQTITSNMISKHYLEF